MKFTFFGSLLATLCFTVNPVAARLPTVHLRKWDFPETEKADTIQIQRFEFKGNTVFTSEALQQVIASYTNRDLSFSELLQARSNITNHYVTYGYVTSGAFLPLSDNQEISPDSGKFIIQVIEGKLEAIEVEDNGSRLEGYVRSRLLNAISPVLNNGRLIEALRLLQQDPLIENISTTLSSGTAPGFNRLSVRVKGRTTLSAQLNVDNNRSPSVGEFQRQPSTGDL